MAKAPFWLRGGKGKLAGSVLFKGERGTIVRENVAPHNPQTGGMMRQRALFATVTQAAKLMLPIIGLSFEGINEGKLNRRKFVQLNTTYLGSIARNILATGTNPRGLRFSGKGNAQLIPNPYIIARGTLKLPKLGIAIINVSGRPQPQQSFSETLPLGEYTPLQLWELLYGMKPGSQLTFPYITLATNPTSKFAMEITDDAGNVIDGIRYASFSAPRIVLATEDGAPVQITAQTTAEQLESYLANGVVGDKTEDYVLGYFCQMEVEAATAVGLPVTLSPDYEQMFAVQGRSYGACGLIYSELDTNGNWRYTNSQMVQFGATNIKTAEGEFVQDYFGLKLENAINTYRKTSTTDKNYLQTGGEGGNV